MDQGGGSTNDQGQLPSARKWTRLHTLDQIIGNPEAHVRTRASATNECLHHAFLSQTEPK